MKDTVKHKGIIETIEGDHIRVRFTQHAACGGCQIASHCNASEARVKVVDVRCYNAGSLTVGQEVTVSTELSMATRSLLLGFGLPLLLMLAVLVACKALGSGDGLAAAAMLLSLLPYYLILWLCRDGIARSIVFNIVEE